MPLCIHGVDVNVVLDRCSTVSYIVGDIEELLQAKRIGHDTTKINVVGGSTSSKGPVVDFSLTTADGEEVRVTAKVIPQILPDISTEKYRATAEACQERFPNLELPTFVGKSMRVHILLAGDPANEVSGKEVYKIGKRLEIRDSKLGGHYIQGSLPKEQDREEPSKNITLLTATNWTKKTCEDIMLLEDMDRRMEQMVNETLYRREFQAEEDDEPSKEEMVARFEESIQKQYNDQGEFVGYEVSLPWKSPDSRQKIPKNRVQTMAMTKSNCARMEKIGKLEEFHQSILDHLKEGIFREVDMQDPEDAARRTFVPSFGVLNPKSTSTSVRLVVAANLPRNNSVNDQLASSMNLLQPLDALIHRWRVHEVGVTGDISKAYYRISINPEDRRAFNIIWYKQPEKREGVMVLELMKLPMGSGPSQCIMLLVFNHHLKQDRDQEVGKHLRDCLYSDNAVTSLPADMDVEDFCLRMHQCMARGGFCLKKFSTNSDSLREKLRNEELYNEAEVEVAQVLGLKWIIDGKDLCTFQTPAEVEEGATWTKRKVLSFCHQAYDGQTGILCGILIRGTAFFSDICPRYDWDTALTSEDTARWTPIYQDIRRATEFTFPRWYGIQVDRPCRLHVFSDASSTHFLACLAYLEQDGKSVLVAGKAKIPPKNLRDKEDTVPKKELEALVMAARLLNRLWEALTPHYPQMTALIHSDATIPLTWIIQESTINRFVTNRVKRFHELIKGRASLHHVSTDQNVADYPSRGLRIEDFLNPDHMYHTGPSLIHDYDLQPFQAAVGPPSKEGEIVLASTEDGEQPRPSVLQVLEWENKTLSQVTRSLANAIKFTRRARKQEDLGERELSKMSMNLLLRAEQAETIPEIINYLDTGQGVRHPWIHSMSLFLDKHGLVRLGGRLERSGLSYGAKYPVLYPKTSPLYRHRILEYHSRNHCGTRSVKQLLQRQFWTPAIGKSIQQIISECYNCRKATGPPFRPPGPPPLPAARVIPESYAAVGVDYTGSFLVRCGPRNRETKPVYLLIISCCSTRHFMAYCVEDLSTETFLHQLRRHAATFGSSHRIYSDRASNFLSAADVLGKTLADEWVSEVGEKLGRKGVTWVPNPSALSPEMSGHIETIVKLLKQGLKRSLGRQLVGVDEFQTLVAEACCVCNDRPLTTDLSPDPRDRMPVSPNKLLLGKSITPLPYGENCLEDLNDPSYIPEEKELGRVWKSLARRLDTFRRQFADDWLMTLRARHIQDHVQDPITAADVGVGDLCLVRKDNVKRSLWDLATVERLVPSADDKVRALELRTRNGVVSRPVGKVFPILKAQELGGSAQPPVNEEVGQPSRNPIAPVGQQDDMQMSGPVPRPSRAAKETGRQRVKGWTDELQRNHEDKTV